MPRHTARAHARYPKVPPTARARFAHWQRTIENLKQSNLPLLLLAIGTLRASGKFASEAKWQGFVWQYLTEERARILTTDLKRRAARSDDPISFLCDWIEHAAAGTGDDDPERAAEADWIHADFAHFGLSPAKPEHRGFMLALMADVYWQGPNPVGHPRGKGGPRKRTAEIRLTLKADVSRLRQAHPRMSRSAVASKLAGQNGYPDYHALLKHVAAVWGPDQNNS